MSSGSESAEPDVRLDGVTKRYDGQGGVVDLSLALPRGAFVSLLGPSGCGKTTSLRLIAGFERPDRGEVFIRGARVTDVPAYRRDFAMVFQHLALFPHLSMADNVAFGLRMTGVSRADRLLRVREALALVRLDGLGGRFPRQLSGGQQQRVAIARALVMRPAVLLLDEPLGALDRTLREDLQVELRALQRQLGLTTLFVTHDQEEALTMSDQVAVMRDGMIEQIGPAREVYARPATAFVATFMGASNLLDATVVGGEAGACIVDCALGRLRAEGTGAEAWAGAGAGSRVRVSIRPERLGVAPPGGAGRLARIRDAIYRGAATQLHLDLAGVALVALVREAEAPDGGWACGGAVSVCAEPGAATLLRDRPGP